MKILFIRHGESEANVRRIISNTGYVHGLTAAGKAQAHDLAGRISGRYENISKIISSPLKRAVETAEILSRHLGQEYTTDGRISEFRVGVLEGRSDDAGWDLFYSLWGKWLSGEDYSAAAPEGETYREIVDRMAGFLQELTARGPQDATILCICHGGIIKTALPEIIGDDKSGELRTRRVENTGVIEVEYDEASGYRCVFFGKL